MKDFLFRGSLSEVDPHVSALIAVESERQVNKLILIPSESQAPFAIREGLGSVFQNIYAEGYPPAGWQMLNEEEILDYKARLAKPEIALRINRNLKLIADRGLILDFNLAALSKGMDEPYLSAGILKKARDMGIAVVPGDDSHSVDTVGRHMEKGIELLNEMGFGTDWKRPASNHGKS